MIDAVDAGWLAQLRVGYLFNTISRGDLVERTALMSEPGNEHFDTFPNVTKCQTTGLD